MIQILDISPVKYINNFEDKEGLLNLIKNSINAEDVRVKLRKYSLDITIIEVEKQRYYDIEFNKDNIFMSYHEDNGQWQICDINIFYDENHDMKVSVNPHFDASVEHSLKILYDYKIIENVYTFIQTFSNSSLKFGYNKMYLPSKEWTESYKLMLNYMEKTLGYKYNAIKMASRFDNMVTSIAKCNNLDEESSKVISILYYILLENNTEYVDVLKSYGITMPFLLENYNIRLGKVEDNEENIRKYGLDIESFKNKFEIEKIFFDQMLEKCFYNKNNKSIDDICYRSHVRYDVLEDALINKTVLSTYDRIKISHDQVSVLLDIFKEDILYQSGEVNIAKIIDLLTSEVEYHNKKIIELSYEVRNDTNLTIDKSLEILQNTIDNEISKSNITGTSAGRTFQSTKYILEAYTDKKNNLDEINYYISKYMLFLKNVYSYILEYLNSRINIKKDLTELNQKNIGILIKLLDKEKKKQNDFFFSITLPIINRELIKIVQNINLIDEIKNELYIVGIRLERHNRFNTYLREKVIPYCSVRDSNAEYLILFLSELINNKSVEKEIDKELSKEKLYYHNGW